jgi:hypothetical protein
MPYGKITRCETCPACRQPAAGEGERCIFCGASLLSETVSTWRAVYHSYSYADGHLAVAALRAHGINARVQQGSLERVIMGNTGSVVQVAEGEHQQACALLRNLRGVRTDTEYQEWLALKARRQTRKAVLIGAVTAALAAALGFGVVSAMRSIGAEAEPESSESSRPQEPASR